MAFLGALIVGGFAVLVPARRAIATDPIDALKQRSGPAASGLKTRPWLVLALVGVAMVGVLASMMLPVPEADEKMLPGSAVGLFTPIMAVTILAALAAGLLSLRPLLNWLSRRHYPILSLAMAVRDAVRHSSRVLPATAAVFIAVAWFAYSTVTGPSSVANYRDSHNEIVGEKVLVVGPNVPINDAIDEIIVKQIATGADSRVTEVRPIWSIASHWGGRWVGLGQPEGKTCGDKENPTYQAALDPKAPFGCTHYLRGYDPGISGPFWLGSETFVIAPETLRATGLPGAEEAANHLAAGHVLVNSLAAIGADGQVPIAHFKYEDDHREVIKTELAPGAFFQGFSPHLTMAPETAKKFGVSGLRYVGGVVVTKTPLSWADAWKIRDNMVASSLVMSSVGTGGTFDMQSPTFWMSIVPLVFSLGLALVATSVAVLLARTQTVGELRTMQALGATPRFIRWFTVSQAWLITGIGASVGTITGLAIGLYQVLWSRRLQLDGPWRHLIWNVPLYLAGVTLLVMLSGTFSALLRTERNLAVRPRD